MKSVQNARQRLLSYPKALASCSSQATVYAKCASSQDNVRKHDCQKEFKELMECVKKAMKEKK